MTDPEIPYPGTYVRDQRWFDMSSIDRDNVKFHLVESSAIQASLAQEFANAHYWEGEADRQAKASEGDVWMASKHRPHEIISAKTGKPVLVDGSDDYARRATHTDENTNELRALELLWRRRREQIEGDLSAFESKCRYLCTLGGVLRGELEMQASG